MAVIYKDRLYEPQRVFLTTASDAEVVAAVTGKKLVLVGLAGNLSAPGSATLHSGGSGGDVVFRTAMGTAGVGLFPAFPLGGEGGAGENLYLATGGEETFTGTIYYIVVDDD